MSRGWPSPRPRRFRRPRDATAAQIADYAASDLLCYFAGEPESLHLRQVEAWEPVLRRAEHELALVFARTTGIIHTAQPEETLAKVKALALELDDFRLTGVAFGTPLFGSAVLAFALERGWLTGEEAFTLSRVDEAYQQEKWGIDEEAAERTARLFEESRSAGAVVQGAGVETQLRSSGEWRPLDLRRCRQRCSARRPRTSSAGHGRAAALAAFDAEAPDALGGGQGAGRRPTSTSARPWSCSRSPVSKSTNSRAARGSASRLPSVLKNRLPR